jgi:hypothetical protein
MIRLTQVGNDCFGEAHSPKQSQELPAAGVPFFDVGLLFAESRVVAVVWVKPAPTHDGDRTRPSSTPTDRVGPHSPIGPGSALPAASLGDPPAHRLRVHPHMCD